MFEIKLSYLILSYLILYYLILSYIQFAGHSLRPLLRILKAIIELCILHRLLNLIKVITLTVVYAVLTYII